MIDPQSEKSPVVLDELEAYLVQLGDRPVLAATDIHLPVQLRNMLAAFPDSKVQATAVSGAPEIDTSHSELTASLNCAGPAWPADAPNVVTVSEVGLTVMADGSVTLALNGMFDRTAVVATVTENEAGALTAAVRSEQPGVFDLVTLVEELAGADRYNELHNGMKELGLTLGKVDGFDYRLERIGAAEPMTFAVTGTAVVTALKLKGNLVFDLGVWLEEKYITGNLSPDVRKDTIDITTLLGDFGLPVADVPSGLAIDELRFSGGFGGIYRLTLKLDGAWSIGPAAAKDLFTVEELAADLSYSTTEKFVGRFSGTVGIGPADIQITAANTAGGHTGWTFGGGIPADDEITMQSLMQTLNLTGAPGPVANLALTDLWLSHTTGTDKYLFICQGDTDITDSLKASIGVTVDWNRPNADYAGTLVVGGFELDLGFHTVDGIETMLAAYRNVSGTQENLHDWVADFSPDLAAVIPEGLRIDLIDAKVIRVKPAAGQASLCLGFDVSADLDLSALPLVGSFLSAAGTLGIEDLQVVYSSGSIDGKTATVINSLLGNIDVRPVPSAGLKPGVGIQAELRLGDHRVPVALGLPAGHPPPQSVSSAADTAPATNATSAWVQVQKQLGVLQVNRIGVIYQHNALLFALDAAVTLGPLRLSFDGLGVGSSLEKFDPEFSLSGLGVSFTNPAVTVTGGLLHVPGPPKGIDFQYDGAAIVETQKFSLAAIGSYAQLTDGMPSLFVFAQLDVPIGEPPLVVTALMAGFGFNRKLTIPTAAQVPGFPLLVLDKPGQKAMDVLDVLEGRTPAPDGTRQQWIAPLEGNYWLAAGAQLTVFEVVTATVVLAAEFGQDLIFALLGTAILQLPLKDENAVTYVYAELGLEATLRPLDGIAQVQAQLSSASYVLTPDCHVTGGFAAAVWFGSNPHAGQFVVTLGGYHPAFHPPSYYPAVLRLGIDWAVSSSVSITADGYLAVTPSCAMAGAGLQVLFHAGPVKAWFTAKADLLVSWRPFFFTAGIAVTVGASVQIDVWFVHKTLSVSVGAHLELWGPPTGGSVTVDLIVTTVTIGFGSGRGATQSSPLTWSEIAAMLPAREQVVTITAVSGLDTTVADTGSSSGKRWLVRARDLRFTTQSAIPASHLRIGDTPLQPDQSGDARGVDVRPMNRTGLAGVHRLTVKHKDRPVDTTEWTTTPGTHNLPASLWGTPPTPFSHTPAAPSADIVADQPVGYAVQAPRPTLAPSRGVFPLGEYGYEELSPGLSPLEQNPVENLDYVFTSDPDVMRKLGDIATSSVKSQRDQLFSALTEAGLYTGGNDSMAALGAAAGHLYSQAPMVEKAGNLS